MKRILNDPRMKSFLEIVGVFIPLGYSLYNGVIGFLYQTVFNICIFVYYALLFLIKFMLTSSNHIVKEDDLEKRKKIAGLSFVCLLILDLVLIGPFLLLIRNQKSVHADKITSIAMAAYSFFNLSLCIHRLVSQKRERDPLKRKLAQVRFTNAIVSLIVLQNTLINVNGTMDEKMMILSIVSSFLLLSLLVFLTISDHVKTLHLSRMLIPSTFFVQKNGVFR